MKKILKKSLIFLLLMVMLPLSSFLVACGAEPGESANAVSFVSNLYDEETGKAIFEVDLNVETTLKYKCNPSTSKSSVRFTIPVEGQTNSSYNRSRFTFLETGTIIVNYDDFEPIEVKINVNGHTDQCIVRLKEYPLEIFVAEPEIVLNSYASYTIPLIGRFKLDDGTFENRQILENEYNYKVVSQNETLVNVPNLERLVICSERQISRSTVVNISILDTSKNPKGIACNLKVNIIESVEDGFLLFDNFDKIVSDGDEIEVDANYLVANADGGFDLTFKTYYISHLNSLVDVDENIYCSSNNNSYLKFNSETNTITINSDHDIELVVTLVTDLLKTDGLVVKIVFTINFIAEI